MCSNKPEASHYSAIVVYIGLKLTPKIASALCRSRLFSSMALGKARNENDYSDDKVGEIKMNKKGEDLMSAFIVPTFRSWSSAGERRICLLGIIVGISSAIKVKRLKRRRVPEIT